MGERRRKLIKNYEDAKLALLLDEYAESYGQVSTRQYEEDLAAGKIKEISDQEAEAQLNMILQRAEEEEARESRISIRFKGVARKIAMVVASIAIFFAISIRINLYFFMQTVHEYQPWISMVKIHFMAARTVITGNSLHGIRIYH